MASGGPGTVGLRLTLAFVAVAVLAVALVAGLAVLFSEHDLSVLAQQRRTDLARTLAVDALSTYSTGNPGWSDVDLAPALELAASWSGSPAAACRLHGPPAGLAGPRRDRRGRPGRLGCAAGRAGGVPADHPAGQPPYQVGPGYERRAWFGPATGVPAELAELAVTFDQMADSLDVQEQLRRDMVADVAHELRTPVAVLQANIEALLDGIVPHTPGADRSAARGSAPARPDGR